MLAIGPGVANSTSNNARPMSQPKHAPLPEPISDVRVQHPIATTAKEFLFDLLRVGLKLLEASIAFVVLAVRHLVMRKRPSAQVDVRPKNDLTPSNAVRQGARTDYGIQTGNRYRVEQVTTPDQTRPQLLIVPIQVRVRASLPRANAAAPGTRLGPRPGGGPFPGTGGLRQPSLGIYRLGLPQGSGAVAPAHSKPVDLTPNAKINRPAASEPGNVQPWANTSAWSIRPGVPLEASSDTVARPAEPRVIDGEVVKPATTGVNRSAATPSQTPIRKAAQNAQSHNKVVGETPAATANVRTTGSRGLKV